MGLSYKVGLYERLILRCWLNPEQLAPWHPLSFDGLMRPVELLGSFGN